MPQPDDGGGAPTVEELLRKSFAGDDTAASKLYDLLLDELLALSRTRGPDLAEDLHEEVVQETWTLVFVRGLDAFESADASAEAYISMVHRNGVESVRAAYRSPGTRSRFVARDE